MWNKVQRGCTLLFLGVFALLWCWLIFIVLVSFQESKKICFLAGCLSVILALAGICLKRYAYNIWKNEKFWFFGSFALLLFMAAGFLYAGLSLRVYPGWDFGSVYLGAVELAENGSFSEQSRWYFTTYPNNAAVCLFLSGIFKLFGGSLDYITLGVLLNIFLMLLGICFLFLLTRRLYGVRAAFFALMLCALFAPFYMHTPIFYTDTFALPFVTGAFLCYQLRKRNAGFLILTAAAVGLGYKIKGSLGVILIAFFIHTWLQKQNVLELLKRSIMLFVPFVLTVAFLTILPSRMSLWSAEDREKNEFPMEHWIAMGLEGCGGYNGDIYWMTASIEGKNEKTTVDREFISKKLKEYGILGMGRHLKEKILFTWGDGVYFAPEKLKREPLQESPLHPWVLYDGAQYKKTYQYCSALQLLLLTGILISVICSLLWSSGVKEIQAMQLAVFGLFLFLLIWETRSRYLVNFVPIFILLGIDGLQGITQYLHKKYQRKKETAGNA